MFLRLAIAGILLSSAVGAWAWVGKIRSERDLARTALERVAEVSAQNHAAAVGLADQLSACIGEATATADRERAAREASERWQAEATAARTAERRARDRIIRESDECRAWADAPVCGEIEGRLRGE